MFLTIVVWRIVLVETYVRQLQLMTESYVLQRFSPCMVRASTLASACSCERDVGLVTPHQIRTNLEFDSCGAVRPAVLEDHLFSRTLLQCK